MEAQVDSEVSPQKLNNFQVISPPPRFSLETLLRLSQRKHFLKREAEFIYYCLILQHFPPFNDSLLKIYSDSENFPFDRNFFLFSTSFFPELKLFLFFSVIMELWSDVMNFFAFVIVLEEKLLTRWKWINTG